MAALTADQQRDLCQLVNAHPFQEWFPVREAVESLVGNMESHALRRSAYDRVIALARAGAVEYNVPTERIKLLIRPKVSTSVSWRTVVSTMGVLRARCLFQIALLHEDTEGNLPGALVKVLHYRGAGELGALSTIANAIAAFKEVGILADTGRGSGMYTLTVDSVQLAEALVARFEKLERTVPAPATDTPGIDDGSELIK